MPGPSPSLPHLEALDGLRGVAVALVVGYHLAPSAVPGGFLGVDVFFVLSGFLITSLLVDEGRREGGVDVGRFYVRRARRLLPALFVLLAAGAVYAEVWGAPEELSRIREHSLWTIGYLANWRYVADGTTYTDLVVGESPLRHTWSLAIEEQFYLVFPLLVVLLGRRVAWQGERLRRRLVGLAAVGAVLSAGWMAARYDVADPSRGYFGTDTRVHSLLVGVVLGAVLVGRPPASGRLARPAAVAAALGVVILVGAVAVSHETSAGLHRGGFLVVALAVAAVIAGLEALPPLRWVLSRRALVGLGLISYGVYLWHWPVVVLLDEPRTGFDGMTLVALRLAVTLGAALLSYRLVERPIRSGALGRAYGRSAVAMAPAGMLLVAGLVVVATVLPAPRSAPIARASASDASLPSTAPVVDVPLPLVILGDSVAHTLAGGVVREFPEFDAWRPEQSPFLPSLVALNSEARPACSFLEGLSLLPNGGTFDFGSLCGEWRNDLAAAFAAEPGGVVLVALANDAGDQQVDGQAVRLGTDAHTALVADLLDDVTAIADSSQTRLVLLALPPRRGVAAQSADEDGGRERLMRDELQSYAESHDGVVLLDLFEQICPAGDCETPAPGFDPDWRYDGLHFTPEGARWVADWITTELVYGGG